MPLDPSIFMQGAQLKAQNDARTQSIIGGFFDKLAANKQKQIDLEKAKATDYEGSAMRVLQAKAQGVAPDPEDLVRAKAYGEFQSMQNAIDPYGNVYSKNRNIFETMGAPSTPPAYKSPYEPENYGINPAGGAMPPSVGNKPFDNDIGELVMPPVGDNYAQVSQVSPPQRDMARGAASAEVSIPNAQNPRNYAEKQLLDAQLTQEKERAKNVQESQIAGFELQQGASPTPTQVNDLVKISAAYNQLTPAFDKYKDLITKYGTPLAGTAEAQELERVSGQIRMTLKELEGLGALQQPDIQAMGEMMGDPILMGGTIGDVLSNPIKSSVSTYTKLKSGKKIGEDSAESMKQYLDEKIVSQANARGYRFKGMPEVKNTGIKPKNVFDLKKAGYTQEQIEEFKKTMEQN